MSQPKNRRRRARRLARLARVQGPSYYVHVSLTGEARNPLGKRSSLNRVIGVGFGWAVIQRDGETFCDGDEPKRRGMVNRHGLVTLRSVEKYIRRMRAGHHRWAASIRAPLWDASWERRGPGKWFCVSAGEGFA